MKRRIFLVKVRRFKPFGNCFPSQHILKQFKRQAERWPSAAARDQHQADAKRLLEKDAIAPSAARLCWAGQLNSLADVPLAEQKAVSTSW
jgi:hypothetical protein